MISISKFPVIAPDGTEYRVKIEEMSGFVGKYVEVTLYLPRKRFGYKKIFSEGYHDGEGVYAASNPNFMTIAAEVVRGYREHLKWCADYHQEVARRENQRQLAVESFVKWDGKITE